MKRDVNATLMVLLLATLFAILLLVLYSTYTYHNLGKRYQSARAEIQKTYIELNVTQNELEDRKEEIRERENALLQKEAQMDKYFRDLNLSKQRESSLGELFDDIRDENLKLETDVEGLSEQLDGKKKEFTDLTRNYNEKVDQYASVVDYCNKMDVKLLEVEQELEKIKDYTTAMETNLESIKDEGNTSIRFDAKRAENKRENIEDKVESIENLLAVMEYWATKFREVRG